MAIDRWGMGGTVVSKPLDERERLRQAGVAAASKNSSKATGFITGPRGATSTVLTNRNNLTTNTQKTLIANSSKNHGRTSPSSATKTPSSTPSSGGGYGGGGYASSAAEKAKMAKAAKRATSIARFNANTLLDRLKEQLATYDKNDKSNRLVRDEQLFTAARNAGTEHWEANANLLGAISGLRSNMGSAIDGSASGNLTRLANARRDQNNAAIYSTLRSNERGAYDNYTDAFNKNQSARQDAISTTESGLRDLRSQLSAGLQNIDGKYYKKPSQLLKDKKVDSKTKKSASTLAEPTHISYYTKIPKTLR